MSTVVQPYVVNPQTGDLTVHGREGLYLELQFKLADGSARNVSDASLFFEVEGTLRVALLAGSATDKRVIQLTRAQVALCALVQKRFALIDETATVPDVLWQGNITATAYTSQPA
jgi:hypothetical protein